jgi:hypothetical protein
MEYVKGSRQIVMNFSELFCKNEIEVLSSNCFKDIWKRYLKHIKKTENNAFLEVIELLADCENSYITLFKLLLEFSIDEIKKMNKNYEVVLNHSEVLYDIVENFYDYWRRLERYGVVYSKNNASGIDSISFTHAMDEFTNVVLNTYRTISQKLLGKSFYIYRALPAGVNAGLLISKNKWMGKDSKYSFLYNAQCIEQILIRPPFISYSNKNKRTGTYPESLTNPIEMIGDDFKATDFYCYAAKVGSALAYIYFHRDYLAHGITLCNLFEFVPVSQCDMVKPDLLYIFGANVDSESVFHYDSENDIYVGVAPHNDSIDYFGYMKKMLLTLYNVKMIDNGHLPLHGACVSLTLKNGTVKNVVIIGDSGAGKSESLEALHSYAGDNISNQVTVFDDMGTFKMVDGEVYAYGTEIGAFVRLDDMASGYAYKEMDRAIFMNPDKENSRLVVPVATYRQIMKGYKVDMVLYANNYDDVENQLQFFTDKEEAINTFIRGARCAKGTTQEVGLVESFFANPFGPVQKEEKTRVLIDEYFSKLFENKVLVGQLYTELAIYGKEHAGPEGAAKKLFEVLGV